MSGTDKTDKRDHLLRVRLNEDEKTQLDKAALNDIRTVSDFVRIAISEHIERMNQKRGRHRRF